MSTNYSVTRDQVISSALRKLGVLEIGSVPDAETIANAALVLNLFIKQMATEGLKLWTVEEGVLPYTQGKTSYVLGGPTSDYFYNFTDPDKFTVTDKPLKIIQSFLRNNQDSPPIDIPMMVISQQEYNILGSKYSTGVTNQIYYNVRQNSGDLYVFLTPDQQTTTNYDLHFMYQRPIDDILTAQGVPEFPNEWFNCLIWNLADQLAIEYSVPANYRQEIAARATAYRDQLDGFDVEATSTFFQPNYQMMFQGFRGNTL